MKHIGIEWLVEQLRNGKELNEELIIKSKEIDLDKGIEIQDYESEVHLLYLALQSVGVKSNYFTCDLINSTLKVFNKLNGKMTIMDSCKIKAEHEKKWNLYFEKKRDNKKY
jgi:hypothetical protein